MENKKDIVFQNVIDALLNTDIAFPPKYLHRFSDISAIDLKALIKVWEMIPATRKVTWLEDLEGISESDTLTSFTEIGKLALGDPSAPVRETGDSFALGERREIINKYIFRYVK